MNFVSKNFQFLVLVFIAYQAHAFPSGAPKDRCGSMMPGHRVDPLTDTPPYEILVKLNSDSNFDGSF